MFVLIVSVEGGKNRNVQAAWLNSSRSRDWKSKRSEFRNMMANIWGSLVEENGAKFWDLATRLFIYLYYI